MNKEGKIAAVVISVLIMLAIVFGTPSPEENKTNLSMGMIGVPVANSNAESKTSDSPCSFNGIELKGKVQFVDSFPDLKVKFVSSFADIDVQFVTSFPDNCGQWQEVTSFPDFTVQIVDSFPDIEARHVTSFPGMN